MYINVDLDKEGMLPDAYGKYAAKRDCIGNMCIRSFPFEVRDIPPAARAIAWILLDWDSVPVCGFPWIHWCAQLELDGEGSAALPDNASRAGMEGLVQGYTSAAKNNSKVATGYIGPCPPDRDHIYTLHVVALDEVCELDEPFWANELVTMGRGHVIDGARIILPSRA